MKNNSSLKSDFLKASRVFLLAILSLVIIFSLCACGEKAALEQEKVALEQEKEIEKAKEEILTYKDTDPGSLVDSKEWGKVPINQLILVFNDEVGKAQAEKSIKELGGLIVGEIEFINLYQIETQIKSEDELSALIETALSMSDIETAFPNVEIYSKDAEGSPCTPLSDPLYTDPNNSAHYGAIGMENAWHILKSSGIKLNNVKVGVLDSSLYLGSGEYKGKVQVSGDKTDEPEKTAQGEIVDGGLNHGTMVTNVIAADYENEGMVGIASVLGEKLSVSVKNIYEGKKTEKTDLDESDITQGIITDNGKNYAYIIKDLVYLKQQVESGSTVINCSYGPAFPRDANQWISKAYEKFFKKIYETHPGVIFVAAAGNEGRDPISQGGLSGSNYFPGGMKLSNLVTVGALNIDGSRADFSNYAASEDAEVTLSAPGVEMLLGTDENGQPIRASGSSFSAPQVSATIALIQSISPGMEAQEIKELLVETAANSVTTDSGSKPIPEGMGKGILRVDVAVLQAINKQRSKEDLSPYSMQELLDRSKVALFAETGFREYTLRASVQDAEDTSVSLKIEIKGKASIEEEMIQSVQVGEEAIWNLTLEEDSVFVRVIRTDTQGCAFMTLKIYESVSGIYEVKGVWDSSMLDGDGPEPLTDWRVRVEQQEDENMTITFLNDSGTILTGTYDDISGVFVGTDMNRPESFWQATWWMQDNTTITFDFDSMPMTAKGVLNWNWQEDVDELNAQQGEDEEAHGALISWTKVNFDMLKLEDLIE